MYISKNNDYIIAGSSFTDKDNSYLILTKSSNLEVASGYLELVGYAGTLSTPLSRAIGYLELVGYPVNAVEKWDGSHTRGYLELIGYLVDVVAVTTTIQIASEIGYIELVGNITDDNISARYTTLPFSMFPGYYSDGTNMYFILEYLPGLSIEEADPITGDWREILQAIFLAWNEYETVSPASLDWETVRCWMLQNDNHKNSIFQYDIGQLRTFLLSFTVDYAITKLVDED